MIVGINYGQDGNRVIALLLYNSCHTRAIKQDIAHEIAQEYDEVYIVSDINFKNNDQEFINEIVTKGCRMV